MFNMEVDVPDKCYLCRTAIRDPPRLGNLLDIDNVKAHEFCLLLSSTLLKSGDDDAGFMGYKASDIVEEAERAKDRTCDYCYETGATVICGERTCKTRYHLPCGLSNRTLLIFDQEIVSYCSAHRKEQTLVRTKWPQKCLVCHEMMYFEDYKRVLQCVCCANTYYHRRCAQLEAFRTGRHFRCSNCNDDQTFKQNLRRSGIYIPENYGIKGWQNRCSTDSCYCPYGRGFYTEFGKWCQLKCSGCMRRNTHARCARLLPSEHFICKDCYYESDDSNDYDDDDNDKDNNEISDSLQNPRPCSSKIKNQRAKRIYIAKMKEGKQKLCRSLTCYISGSGRSNPLSRSKSVELPTLRLTAPKSNTSAIIISSDGTIDSNRNSTSDNPRVQSLFLKRLGEISPQPIVPVLCESDSDGTRDITATSARLKNDFQPRTYTWSMMHSDTGIKRKYLDMEEGEGSTSASSASSTSNESPSTHLESITSSATARITFGTTSIGNNSDRATPKICSKRSKLADGTRGTGRGRILIMRRGDMGVRHPLAAIGNRDIQKSSSLPHLGSVSASSNNVKVPMNQQLPILDEQPSHAALSNEVLQPDAQREGTDLEGTYNISNPDPEVLPLATDAETSAAATTPLGISASARTPMTLSASSRLAQHIIVRNVCKVAKAYENSVNNNKAVVKQSSSGSENKINKSEVTSSNRVSCSSESKVVRNEVADSRGSSTMTPNTTSAAATGGANTANPCRSAVSASHAAPGANTACTTKAVLAPNSPTAPNTAPVPKAPLAPNVAPASKPALTSNAPLAPNTSFVPSAAPVSVSNVLPTPNITSASNAIPVPKVALPSTAENPSMITTNQVLRDNALTARYIKPVTGGKTIQKRNSSTAEQRVTNAATNSASSSSYSDVARPNSRRLTPMVQQVEEDRVPNRSTKAIVRRPAPMDSTMRRARNSEHASHIPAKRQKQSHSNEIFPTLNTENSSRENHSHNTRVVNGTGQQNYNRQARRNTRRIVVPPINQRPIPSIGIRLFDGFVELPLPPPNAVQRYWPQAPVGRTCHGITHWGYFSDRWNRAPPQPVPLADGSYWIRLPLVENWYDMFHRAPPSYVVPPTYRIPPRLPRRRNRNSWPQTPVPRRFDMHQRAENYRQRASEVRQSNETTYALANERNNTTQVATSSAATTPITTTTSTTTSRNTTSSVTRSCGATSCTTKSCGPTSGATTSCATTSGATTSCATTSGATTSRGTTSGATTSRGTTSEATTSRGITSSVTTLHDTIRDSTTSGASMSRGTNSGTTTSWGQVIPILYIPRTSASSRGTSSYTTPVDTVTVSRTRQPGNYTVPSCSTITTPATSPRRRSAFHVYRTNRYSPTQYTGLFHRITYLRNAISEVDALGSHPTSPPQDNSPSAYPSQANAPTDNTPSVRSVSQAAKIKLDAQNNSEDSEDES